MVNENKKQTKDPFKGLVLDEYEQQIEDSIAKGDYIKDADFIQRKNMLEESARNYLVKAETKQISLRVNVDDLSAIKAKAKRNNIPYQTLIGSLIRQYAEGRSELVL